MLKKRPSIQVNGFLLPRSVAMTGGDDKMQRRLHNVFLYRGDGIEDDWDYRRRFIAFRKRTGFTQQQLARLIGVARPTISHIENGRVPRLRTWKPFRRIEKAHNRPKADLNAFMAEIRQEMGLEGQN